MRVINFFLLFYFLFNPHSFSNETSWDLLKDGGKVVFIRHAYAPGGGDPDNFELEDCSTQRNLNQQGIRQSQTIGKLFIEYSIPVDFVYSSQWCRCQDTARYAFGDYENFSALNSTFSSKYQKNHTKQMLELSEFINKWDDSRGT